MITEKEVNAFLECKKPKALELKTLEDFDKPLQVLASIIMKSDDAYKKVKYYTATFPINLELFTSVFGKDNYTINPFDSQKGKALASFIFGEFIGASLAKVWKSIDSEPYQDSYSRRSFRSSKIDRNTLISKLQYVQELYQQRLAYPAFFAISPIEIVQYMGYKSSFARAVYRNVVYFLENDENEALKEVLWDILANEDEVGVVSRELIKAMLLSHNPNMWEMVGKLLLSAQRQEGLRQTILETLDETSMGALQYIIKLILEHELYRFSSVVRAIDVWFGFEWYAPKKNTIKSILEYTLYFFENPKEINASIKNSKNNLETYIGLWVCAMLFDVERANTLAVELIKTSTERHKKSIAFIFIEQTKRSVENMDTWIEENFASGDTILDAYMLPLLKKPESISHFFERIVKVSKTIPKEGLEEKGSIFEWYSKKVHSDYFYALFLQNSTEEERIQLSHDISLLPSRVRDNYLSKVFPLHCNHWRVSSVDLDVKIKRLDISQEHWQRKLLHQALLDKSTGVHTTALTVLRSVTLYTEEYEAIITLFKRKAKDMREYLIEFILRQEKDKVQFVIDTMIVSSNISQRLGALEILLGLNKDKTMNDYVSSLVIEYQTRKKISVNERLYLDKFVKKNEDTPTNSRENGYGVIDYTKLHPIVTPIDKFPLLSEDESIFDSLVDIDKIERAVKSLVALIKTHENDECTYEQYGQKETGLLGQYLQYNRYDITKIKENFASFPLSKVWEKWYVDINLNAYEMLVIYYRSDYNYGYNSKSKSTKLYKYTPPYLNIDIDYKPKIHTLIEILLHTFADIEKIHKIILDSIESRNILSTNYTSLNLLYTKRSQKSSHRYWLLYMFIFYKKYKYIHFKEEENITQIDVAKREIKIDYNYNETIFDDNLTLALYKEKVLNDDDLLYQLLLFPRQYIPHFESTKTKSKYYKVLPHDKYQALKKVMIEIELNRGEVDTKVTPYVAQFEIEGIDYFKKILERIGNAKINTHLFSPMLQKTSIKDGESFENFKQALSPLKLSNKRWLEIAMYKPLWSKWIGNLIGLERLGDAVMWFHKGALDLHWFNEIYLSIKKQNWSVLTEFSKYTDGNHRLIKLYSSILLKEVKIREIKEKIKNKRDKDYLKGLGLVPLSRSNAQKDILDRYTLMQTFLKESKQFGAMRQESEKEAVETAIENLSKTAGYSDSIRLSLAMEAKTTQEIMKDAILDFDDILFSLKITAMGKAEIEVEKAGKIQKSIPQKYKKYKALKGLIAKKNTLKKQYSRVLKFLENAMINQEVFAVEDIELLMHHAIIKPLLSKLLLTNIQTQKIEFYPNICIDLESKESTFSIAHPYHLHKENIWEKYQTFAFDTQLVQPFKQIFRELYLPNEEERKEGEIYSKRYEGHQVQANKMVALLQSRGWKVEEYDGLQKTFAKQGFLASIYLNDGDWFTPSDIEAPSLDSIQFYSSKSYERIKLCDIDSLIFSEIMRDIDLVVSVAHVGGVDIEMTHSSLEMRAVLAKETARLFKLNNVEIKERHIFIKGKYKDYNIHLGSALVSSAGLSLSIIPVHSQHRGNLFLPFIDNDPKLSEIISKMKLLAEDDKIQDPSILRQIIN